MRELRNASIRSLAATALAALTLGVPMAARAELPPLIPREVLFGNPERVSPKISPDGKRMAWIAPDRKNVRQVWVKTIGKDDDKVVTDDKKRGIRMYEWAENSKVLLYMQDNDGDEDFHVYGVDLDAGKVRDFTPHEKIQARITAIDPNFPDEVLLSINIRDRRLHDVHRLNVTTGELTLDTTNPGDIAAFMADPKFKVRAAQAVTPDGGTEIRIRDDEQSDWRTWVKVGPDEILEFLDFTADGKSAYLRSSLGSDTARVVEAPLTGDPAKDAKVVASSDAVDAGGVVVNRKKHIVQAVAFAPGRRRWEVIDPSVKEDFEGIARLFDGDFDVINRDTEDRTWLVSFTYDRGPIRYYAWDRQSKEGKFLFVHQSKLEGLRLAPMKPVEIKSRDGLTLHSYLTLPEGVPSQGLPMVLFVHGGPWGRDTWGFNPMAQWLANRGYACLQVNFRASAGYGKKFLHAGDKQWGKTMHDDLIDAVDWAVKGGIADKAKVAIMGGSYGGYAALAGVAFTPEVFACAVDIVGPSNLRTLISTIPPYWKPMRAMLVARVGDIDDPRDAELIKEASPLFKADKIVRPLMIGQGANDPRVKQAESEQIVEAIERNKGSVTYVVYPDEGHGFARPENAIDFNARAEEFLARYLGGRCEPVQGDKYPGSTAVVKVIGG
jgi:dipeptidyl aminopeptidase/acylaminoacyl peptidase